MYSQNELDEAVAAGALSAEAANALRMHIEGQRSTPTVDEEQFRLLTGFNDIFVSIAAAILLFAVAWIGHQIGQNMRTCDRRRRTVRRLAPLAVAATAWGLALFFTAKRRMALALDPAVAGVRRRRFRNRGVRPGARRRPGQLRQ